VRISISFAFIFVNANKLPHLSLREMDIELMRRLSPRVNVIPVIGRSDSLTPSELRAFKQRVRIIGITCLLFM
jgi:septin family protein